MSFDPRPGRRFIAEFAVALERASSGSSGSSSFSPLRFYLPCPAARKRTEEGGEGQKILQAEVGTGGLFCVSFGACDVHGLTGISRPCMKAACVL